MHLIDVSTEHFSWTNMHTSFHRFPPPHLDVADSPFSFNVHTQCLRSENAWFLLLLKKKWQGRQIFMWCWHLWASPLKSPICRTQMEQRSRIPRTSGPISRDNGAVASSSNMCLANCEKQSCKKNCMYPQAYMQHSKHACTHTCPFAELQLESAPWFALFFIFRRNNKQ